MRATFGLVALLASLGCASVSTSPTRTVQTGTMELEVSARAERGMAADRLIITVGGADVAEGELGPDRPQGTLVGDYGGLPVEARCGQRWLPGVYIAYRCVVRVGESPAVSLEF